MNTFIWTVFTSAFLLFQAQPIIAKFILPWFGGTPAVWTSCMLFFQVGLLVGYGYAHLLATRVSLNRQPWVHLALVLVSIFTLPITPEQTHVATADQIPLLDILFLLTTTIGFPFIVLSASAPLLQYWFANIHPNKSPFKLYALSNLGSLVALLSYPFLVEPALALKTQTTIWSTIYLCYAGLTAWCAWPILTKQRMGTIRKVHINGTAVTWPRRITWVALAACGSTVLLATTNQMSQDVAVIPFLWVLPLSLYLVTFIICFGDDNISLAHQISIYTTAMFACCMVCHGEMVRPARNQLSPQPAWRSAPTRGLFRPGGTFYRGWR